MPERVLIVDPDTSVQRTLETWLTRRGFLVTAAPDGARALSLLEARDYALLIVEHDLPGPVEWTELLERGRAIRPGLPVIMLATEERFDWAVEGLRASVLDYVLKPARVETLGSAIEPALERRRVQADSQRTVAELQAVTDEFLRNMVRLERENLDLREQLETGDDDQPVVDEFNILCVTSDDVLAADLAKLAEPRGMPMTRVKTGEDALRMLEELFFNLVIIDAMLPGIDGVEVTKRTHARVPDSEVMIVVGFTSADSAIKAMEQGASAFLVKPIETLPAGERIDGIRRRLELSAQSRKYLAAFRSRYKDFLDRYQSVRQRLSTLKPEDL